MAQPNAQGKGQNQEGQEDNLKVFTLGHKDLEGKVAEFLYDKGTYTIVDIVGEEKTVVFKGRSAQEAYTKWNVYIGRKKERPARERNDEEDSGKREEGRRGGRGNNGGRSNGGQEREEGGRQEGGKKKQSKPRPQGQQQQGQQQSQQQGKQSQQQTPGQKSNQEVLQALRESNGLEGGASKHRRRRRHGRGNGGNNSGAAE